MQVAQAANYRIVVEGVLDPVWLECLGGLEITEERQPGRPVITRLEGCLTDEAALQGVLDHRRDAVAVGKRRGGRPAAQEHVIRIAA